MLQTMPGVKPRLSLICKKMTINVHKTPFGLRGHFTRPCFEAKSDHALFKSPFLISYFFFLSVSMRARPGAQLFICKWELFAREWNLIFIWKDGHKDSLWERGLRQLGNGVYQSYICALPCLVVHGSFKWRGPCFSDKTIVSLKITVNMIFKMYDGVIYLSSVKVEFSLLLVKQA